MGSTPPQSQLGLLPQQPFSPGVPSEMESPSTFASEPMSPAAEQEQFALQQTSVRTVIQEALRVRYTHISSWSESIEKGDTAQAMDEERDANMKLVASGF